MNPVSRFLKYIGNGKIYEEFLLMVKKFSSGTCAVFLLLLVSGWAITLNLLYPWKTCPWILWHSVSKLTGIIYRKMSVFCSACVHAGHFSRWDFICSSLVWSFSICSCPSSLCLPTNTSWFLLSWMSLNYL